MKIQRVTFLGVRGLPDAAHDFTNPATGAPHDVIVVSGPSASGKTRVLEALVAAKEAIAPYGPMSTGAAWIPPGTTVAKVALSFWLDEEEQLFAGTSSKVLEAEATFLSQRTRSEADEGLVALLERYEHTAERGKLEYFPANRKIPPWGPFHGLSPIEQRLLRATKDPRKYGFVSRFLREIEHDRAAAERFAARLAALSPTCRHVPGAASDGVPRCFSSKKGPPVLLSELSDSEVDAVLFAATASAIHLGRSLVLIDRPELYSDPAGVPALVAGLRALGEGNQLFLASSSPDLAAAAAPAYVLRLEGE